MQDVEVWGVGLLVLCRFAGHSMRDRGSSIVGVAVKGRLEGSAVDLQVTMAGRLYVVLCALLG